MAIEIKNVSDEDLEIIGEIGAKKLNSLSMKYDKNTLVILEERALYRERLKFWELGFKYFFPFSLLFVLFGSLLGWIYYEKILRLMDKLDFSLKTWVAIGSGVTSLAILNIADIGRMIFLYDETKHYSGFGKRKEENVEDEVIDEGFLNVGGSYLTGEQLREKVTQILEEKGGLPTTKIIRILNVNIGPKSFGKVLKNIGGFKQIRSSNKRFWLPEKDEQNCTEQTEETSNDMMT